MPEEVLFKFEEEMDGDSIATYLRTVADNLENGEPIMLEAGDESVTLTPPSTPTFELKAERETESGGGPAERSVEFELEWREGTEEESGDGSLRIE